MIRSLLHCFFFTYFAKQFCMFVTQACSTGTARNPQMFNLIYLNFYIFKNLVFRNYTAKVELLICSLKPLNSFFFKEKNNFYKHARMNCLELVLETSVKLQFLMKSSYYLTKFHGFIVFAPTLVYILIHIHIWNFLVYICIHFGSEGFFGWSTHLSGLWLHSVKRTLLRAKQRICLNTCYFENTGYCLMTD